jgi:hypothetical protein
MELGIQIGAAVLDDRETIIGISSFEESGEDNAAGRNPVENQRINRTSAKNHGEIRASEGADAMIGDDDLALFRSDLSRGITPSGPRNSC